MPGKQVDFQKHPRACPPPLVPLVHISVHGPRPPPLPQAWVPASMVLLLSPKITKR